MSKASKLRHSDNSEYVIYRKDYCEECGAKNIIDRDENGFLIRRRRILTSHHKDGNHANNSESNIQTLCITCHKNKHAQ